MCLAAAVSKIGSEPRAAKVWVLEVASFATYPRPAFALLQPISDRPHGQWDWLADGVHLLLLLTLKALALIWCFAAREQKWAMGSAPRLDLSARGSENLSLHAQMSYPIC